ncbi:hypothetical protein [Catellatospora sp. NPDC049133]|uniref:hypothetical protein n=1 Tax=Catellatospora sp. NPDC049133 TaxID=3155499 RepID=UPI0033F73636
MSFGVADFQVTAVRNDERNEKLSNLQKSITQVEMPHRDFRASLLALSAGEDDSKLTQTDLPLTKAIEDMLMPALDLRSSWLDARSDLGDKTEIANCLDKVTSYFDAISRVSRPASWNSVNGGVVDQRRATEYAMTIPHFDVRTIDTIDAQSHNVAEVLKRLERDIGSFRDGTSSSAGLSCDHLFFVSA